MAASAVGAIEPASIGAVQPMHPTRRVRLGRLHDEMEVIRHEHPRSDRPSEPLRRQAEEDEKRLAVAITAEDVASLIAALGEVIERSSELDS